MCGELLCPPLGESFIGGSTRVHLDVPLKMFSFITEE